MFQFAPLISILVIWGIVIAIVYKLIKNLIRFTIQEIKRELKDK
ncbi:hypothetical protein [Sporolactobacillus shoreicorticis]|uniref:Uncharacterized protein n=1 Tax=Sporolactobacillus shoreicorticis TaxID=1923877 RepID=A0ABW5S578_9BACL|nr:hypothetical protein [Sporolactobacillus shoreicorticis]